MITHNYTNIKNIHMQWPYIYVPHGTCSVHEYNIQCSLSSYHQKYLLRKELMLKVLSLTEDELIKSHTATALNGYAGGYGTTEGLEKELPKFIDNLPLYGRDLIKKVLAEAQRQE